jgi:hypothetical protein
MIDVNNDINSDTDERINRGVYSERDDNGFRLITK